MAGGNHAIGVAVETVAGQAHGGLDPVVGRALGALEQGRRGGEQRRIGEPGASARADRHGLPVRPAIPGLRAVAPIAFAGEGLRHHAEDRRALVEEADQRAPAGQAGDEGAGAVDRVEHPDIIGVRPLAAVLLADDAVVRPGLVDQPAHGGLGVAVGDGHRIEAGGALALHRGGCPKMRHDRISGSVGQFVDELGEPGKVCSHCASRRFVAAKTTLWPLGIHCNILNYNTSFVRCGIFSAVGNRLHFLPLGA